jgi:IS1 family transposase
VDSKKAASLPPVAETLRPAEGGDVLEVDELCSFVGRKDRKVWTWTALCRRTRQVVACVVGDRSEATCRKLWEAIPEAYRGCRSYSDFWAAYASVFPQPTHRSVDKKSGQLAHIERWHNTVRQRLARYVRKTLSFSRSLAFHEAVTRWFVIEYNLGLLPSVTS